MNESGIEPRTTLWAAAEVVWVDQTGTPLRMPATLEDTSPSGACIRVKSPITIGSRLTVKWHREQFSAVARNCRTDGRDYLLGVRRELGGSQLPALSLPPNRNVMKQAAALAVKVEMVSLKQKASQEPPLAASPATVPTVTLSAPATPANPATDSSAPATVPPSDVRQAEPLRQPHTVASSPPIRRAPLQTRGLSPRQERKVMASKNIFPKFWRRPQNGTGAPDKALQTEAPMNTVHAHPAEGLTSRQGDLLSYDDIYHAAGILTPRSGYDISKVVEMLHNDRIRELSKEVKRASVLMALEAAGASPEDLLQDAKRREQALASYEAGQQKQLEEYEARKGQENAKLQAEMERVTAHYAERIQQNQNQVAKEKEVLRSWQMLKQNENQRIAEVIELCSKPSAAVPSSEAKPALSAPSPSQGTASQGVPSRPSLVAEASTRS